MHRSSNIESNGDLEGMVMVYSKLHCWGRWTPATSEDEKEEEDIIDVD